MQGTLGTPPNSSQTFFVNAMLQNDKTYKFNSQFKIDSSFTLVELLPYNGTDVVNCLMAEYDLQYNQKLYLQPVSCSYQGMNACYRQDQSIFTPCVMNPFDFLFDQGFEGYREQKVNQNRSAYKEILTRFNSDSSYWNLFRNLWYTSSPCFDVQGLTAERDGDNSFLKYCEWQGVSVPCAAIFKTFPTDRGICCSFNMAAAQDLFKKSTYSDLVQELQAMDMQGSFINKTILNSSSFDMVQTAEPGTNQGLFIILDAHTNLFTLSSTDTDDLSYIGTLNERGNFPLTTSFRFDIKAGFTNQIALSAIIIQGDDGIRSIAIPDRKCLFADENQDMQIFTNYTQSNCLFECSILYAYENLRAKNNTEACIPWYFPSPETIANQICDPWQNDEFLLLMQSVSEETCEHCLPDCTTTIFDMDITTSPLETCDDSNLGISPLCNIFNGNLAQPTLYASQIYTYYPGVYGYSPNFVLKKVAPSTRASIQQQLAPETIMTVNDGRYNAYGRDIAKVEIFFKTPTVLQYESYAKMTWIDFYSNIGGILGLVLGMGIISVFEFIWLQLRITSRLIPTRNDLKIN